MIPVSQFWTDNSTNHIFHIKANLYNESTGDSFSLTDEDFMMGSVRITDATSDSDTFTIGGTITNTFQATLKNTTGKFDDFDFGGAIIEVQFGVITNNGSYTLEEFIDRGVYTVDRPDTMGDTIEILAYDNMDKLNKYYIGKRKLTPTTWEDITFPISASLLVQYLFEYCDVSVASSFWSLPTFNINSFEYDESTTCRQVLGWILQIAGGYARINNVGEAECKWYTDNVNDPNAWDLDSFSQCRVGMDDISITGVRVYLPNTVDEFQFETVGSDGYILAIQDNPLVTASNMQAIAQRVYSQVDGLRFRIFDATIWGSPNMEAGDNCIIYDYRDREFVSIITNLEYALGGSMRVALGAETPGKNSLETANPQTETIAGATRAAYDYILAKKISADYVTAGTLEGTVFAKDLIMQGGSVDITTDEEWSVIRLGFEDSVGLLAKTIITPYEVKITNETNGAYARLFADHGRSGTQNIGLIIGSDPPNPYVAFTAQYGSDGSAGITMLGSPLADFVIAQGGDGYGNGWTWRKWYSGILECWYRETKSSVAITSRSGSGYYARVTDGLSYPVAFLSGTYPVVQWSVQCDEGYAWIAPAYNYSNAYTGGAYVYSFSSVTKSFTYNIYAKGRWK